MSLCARVVAEVQSVRQSSFHGVKLHPPTAVCCTRGCTKTLDTLQRLSTAALTAGDPDAVTRCKNGHTTRLQPFVGLLPGAEDALAAELMYWLRVVQHRVRCDAVGSSDNGDGDAIVPPLHAHMFTSLVTALVRWAHTFDAAAPSSRCPRVWVPVLGSSSRHDPPLVLRPVCEHTKCLHAVLPYVRRGMADVTSLVATRGGEVDRGQTSTFPLRTLAERSGRVLAALTQAPSYGDELEQTMSQDKILAAVEGLLAHLPLDEQASIQRLSDLHKDLRKPLRWVRVVARRQGLPRGAAQAQSHRWLCKLHATETELAHVRERQHEVIETVSMLVEWYWHDDVGSHAFDHVCTATLEHALQSKLAEAALHCGNHTQTVQFLASGIVMKESGARVCRVSLKTCVTVFVVCCALVWWC